MKKKLKDFKVKIPLGNAVYTVDIIVGQSETTYDIRRNKRPVVVGSVPSKLKEDTKLIIAENLLQQAIFQINGELHNVDLYGNSR